MANDTTPTADATATPTNGNDGAIYTPTVTVALSVGTAELTAIGVTKLKNALGVELRKELAKVQAADAALARLRADRDARTNAVDEPDFLVDVEARAAAVRALYGLADDDDRLKLTRSLQSYARSAGRTFRAEIAYVAPGGGDSAQIGLTRTYPTPAEVEALEAQIDDRTREREAADRRARDLRIQINDRQGLVDQVTADLGVAMLQQAGDQGRTMLDALMAEPVAGVGNPVLALLDGRSDG